MGLLHSRWQRRFLITASLFLALLAPLLTLADEEKTAPQKREREEKTNTGLGLVSNTREFHKAFDNQSSWQQAEAIKKLEPEIDADWRIIEKLLKKETWFLREAVVNHLSTAAEKPSFRPVVEKRLEKAKPLVAEAIIRALGLTGDGSYAPILIKHLSDKDWQVRRSAAIALSEIPDKRAISAILEAWQAEREGIKGSKQPYLVIQRLRKALEENTGEQFTILEDWRNWWAGAKESWQKSKRKKHKKSELSTQVDDVKLTLVTQGEGKPILVIPEYGFESNYLKTYLRPLAAHRKLMFLELPGANDFTPKLPNEPGFPAPKYPIEKIVEALEKLILDLREKKALAATDKIDFFCHGLGCWLGMAFASKYPKLSGDVVLVAPSSGGQAWVSGNDRLVQKARRLKDEELLHYAQSRQVLNGKRVYQASSLEEQRALTRAGFTTYFFDYRNLEIALALGPRVEKSSNGKVVGNFFSIHRPMGQVLIPTDFDVSKLAKTKAKLRVVIGSKGTMTSAEDARRIVSHYRGAKLKVFKNAARMPFIETNKEFIEYVTKVYSRN